MRRKQHGNVRNGETGKDREFRGQRLSQKHKERFFRVRRKAGGIQVSG